MQGPRSSIMEQQPLRSIQGGLSDEQRARIAQQRELALARRLAKGAAVQNNHLSRLSEPRVAAADHRSHSSECRPDGNGTKSSPYCFPSAGGAKRGLDEDVVDAAEQGWRSVRKRPVPGQSFGREVVPERAADDGGACRTGRGGDQGTAEVRPNGGEGSQAHADGPEVVQKPRAKLRPSSQQMQVLNAIRQGKSVFVTGSAGTGKSFVIGYAVRLLKMIHRGEGVYVTASTGLAACALGGTTLHSFAGVGLGTGSKESLLDKAKSRREVRSRWLFARALIIDEISMIDGGFFDKLDYLGRLLRNRSQPFGGIQLVVTGDFYQLPPVSPENLAKFFAFEADCWHQCFDLQIELQAVFRQSDEEFVGMLNEIRRGHCSPSVQLRLQSCFRPVDENSDIIPTRLYPLKMDVSRENDQNLRALGRPTVVFTAKDEARNDFVRRQLDNVRVGTVISLSLGAQVVLAKNLESGAGLVNGARGVVVGFTTPDDPRSLEIQKTARSVNPSGMWPLVRFACDNLERIIGPETWTISEGDVEVAQRTQVPLLLAWALSVHKCQGMTLDRVQTDLCRAFDFGMVYVALSRVKSLDGLRLTGFDPSKIKVHPKVSKFYDKLQQGMVMTGH